MTKLAGMGITMSFWKWTQSYLLGITQQVKLPGVLSRHGEAIAGVPKGGVISPKTNPVHLRIPVSRTVGHKQSFVPRGAKLNLI